MSLRPDTARRNMDDYHDYPSLVVRTPHGACYVPPPKDLPEVVAAIQRLYDALDQEPRRRPPVPLCSADTEGCGRHSGIPACCRAWWHTVWMARRAYTLPRPAWWFDDWGYVACPGCRQCGARVHLLACPTACLTARPARPARPPARPAVSGARQLAFPFDGDTE